MRSLKILLMSLLGVVIFATASYAHVDPTKSGKVKNNDDQEVNFREQCTTASAQIDQDVNNVRARLTSGGDVWWDRNDGAYIVPKVEPGEIAVSSIFAGAVWLGGQDPGGNLKVACQTYGNSNGNSDFWSGPIDPINGTTDKEVCDDWDRFFEVSRQEIDEHINNLDLAARGEIAYTEDMIPFGVRGWPAKGNEYFFDVWEFELPNTPQSLAGFWDEDEDGNYDPLRGDYPVIEIRGCDEPNVPDEMIFWIYNDQGGGAPHGETSGQPIKMEVQVQTFAFETNDEINDMTFQRYKLINRADENIEDTYFAMWVDADLGCHLDDYVGCDTARSFAIVYNADAIDGQPGTDCSGGVPTYGFEVPVVGIDYFRGPLNEFRQELGMSSFTYFNNPGFNGPPPGTTDPNTAQEFYNYLRGLWRDGTPFTFGNDGYNAGSTDSIAYAFPSPPNLMGSDHWSMCTEDLPEYDRRTVQASGPFLLQPGAVNELIIGAVWVPDFSYPCPDISRILFADDISQSLFDNCFDITDGPDAPDVDWVELDREVVAVLTNDTSDVISNNAYEAYNELDLQAPEFINIDGVDIPLDSPANHFFFEGYKLYQLIGPDVGIADLDDAEKSRLIFQADIKNGVTEIINWTPEQIDEIGGSVWIPESKVQGNDDGIRHTFKITEDQFADGSDRRLINHKKYYFTAIAYAYNKYEQFNPTEVKGQRNPYLEGRRNIKTYVVIPRPITDRGLNSDYGDGAVITRLDGVGVGGNFLDISDETRDEILNGTFDGDILYQPGAGPIDVTIYNPLEVKDGIFDLTFIDGDMTDDVLENDARWELSEVGGSETITSETTIEKLNEQILADYGFTITLGQTLDVGQEPRGDNGVIGYQGTYSDLTKPFWFAGIPDDFPINIGGASIYNYNATGPGEPDEILDQERALSTIGENGFFTPYQLADWRDKPAGTVPFYLTPAWRANGSIVRDADDLLPELNNVDIVFTSDKSLWSRCVIVETKSPYYDSFGFNEQNGAVSTEGGAKQFDVRQSPAVTKDDNDGDGLPDRDTEDSRLGMGWFPGYAIDVETGKRLNIFFGENSVYHEENGFASNYTSAPTGRDMMFNPTNQLILNTDNFGNIMTFYTGGQHFIYVASTEYDECAFFHERLSASSAVKKVKALKDITWTALPLLPEDVRMESYANGLIPNDFTVKLRVDNPYAVSEGTGEYNGYPTYRFELDGAQASELDEAGIEKALQEINVVPNPYYGFSDYEGGRTETVVKITNLPAKCVITIYSLDGKFIRQYNRDEAPQVPDGNNRGVPFAQVIPDVEWDLKNNKGIPVSAGAYLIHVDAPGLGERTLKWFGMPRQFDPSAL
jgi:hypothetical protein